MKGRWREGPESISFASEACAAFEYEFAILFEQACEV